uniref:Uncharacterized protein n=1 Tax=Anopheles coluzzii TaxID=1518534 RepID=A0A6E8WBC2_ANOCL
MKDRSATTILITVSFVVAALLVAANVPSATGSPLPGLGGMPADFAGLGHGFGAQISNIIKGNTYDQFERVMRKLSKSGRKSSSESGDVSSAESDSLFGIGGSQFGQLLEMLQQQMARQQGQDAGEQPGNAVPFAAIDNSVD